MNGTGIIGKLLRKQRKGTISILVRGKDVIDSKVMLLLTGLVQWLFNRHPGMLGLI